MTTTPHTDNPHSQCCSENPGEGCGLPFPAKTAAGLCQKCTLLNALDPKSEKYQQALGYLQCLTCGVAWQRLPFTDKCGPCHQKVLEDAGLINHSVDTALQARSNAFNIRIHRGPKQNTLASIPVAPTIALNTAALDQFRNVGHNDADCIKVYAEPRLVNKIDASLGSTSRSYSPETPMEEIKAELINGWNIAWLKKHDFPLRIEDSELRFHGNQNILENSQYLAVLDSYQAHKSAGNHEAYFTKTLELWMESSETPTPGSRAVKGSSLSKKRKSTGGNAAKENDEISAKRPRVSAPIESTFQRLLPGPNPAKSTEIEIVLAHIAVDSESCCVQVSWPDNNAPTQKAVISNTIFKSGKMKHCYKLSIGDEQYVAKRFYEIGRGEDEVTLSENTNNLLSDATRCEMARWLLRRFRNSAAEITLEVAKNFEITQLLVVAEVVHKGKAASPASGATLEVLESQPGSRVVWLLEPLRNAAVTHYTGTMEHPAGTGQLAHTLSAFVHFAFQQSGIIFADIQGSCGRLSNKTMGIIIFDLMTHTEEEDSGVGDYGPKGIARWRDQHDCNAFCKRLDLEAGGSDNDDDDE
ncbi:kinase-like domain-containing protein [Mycena albidolilacea]|uniref:Kinase-like domain-containing protein n=1 Tax=Mycena albidolilacea TaxID=1033008 RepID=A0AAD7EAU9_9AGAR|nr:kinase-like domain-containing protein [Mycena albidolilacea]